MNMLAKLAVPKRVLLKRALSGDTAQAALDPTSETALAPAPPPLSEPAMVSAMAGPLPDLADLADPPAA